MVQKKLSTCYFLFSSELEFGMSKPKFFGLYPHYTPIIYVGCNDGCDVCSNGGCDGGCNGDCRVGGFICRSCGYVCG